MVVYITLAVDDAGAMGLLVLYCCVNECREECGRCTKNTQNIGGHFCLAGLLLYSVHTGLYVKHSGDFASHSVALV